MNILHYSLGLPPYRSGGLTKFCMDLMTEQLKEGHDVSLLWPGRMRFLAEETSIKKSSAVDGIDSFELINPVPVSLDEGIKDFDAFIADGDKAVYDSFLDDLKPDVIHVHTLMGLHKSLLISAKEKGIRAIFTAHDFFPVCPKVTMFRNGQICSSVDTCEECGSCNSTALSLKKIFFMQSAVYRQLKDSKVVKILRKQHRDRYLADSSQQHESVPVGRPEEYRKLRRHYQELLSMMDMIHYNSTITGSVYQRVFDLPDSCIIPITHRDIADHKVRRSYSDGRLRIRYSGPQAEGKGYYLLKEALDGLWKERQNFCLDIHFTPTDLSPYMTVHDRFTYSELQQIYNETDIMIAPSIWYETFGYTVLEALSYGVPVMISSTVGASDILAEGAGIVIDDISAEKLLNEIKKLTPERLDRINHSIVDSQHIMTMPELSGRIIAECYMEA